MEFKLDFRIITLKANVTVVVELNRMPKGNQITA